MSFADIIKDFKMWRLPSVMQLGPKCYHKYPDNRERQKEITEENDAGWSREKCSHNQGMPTAARSWKR